MKQSFKALLFILLLFVTIPFFAQVQQSKLNELAALSNTKPHHGWAASFVGVHNNALIMAGGSAFPDAKPWENGIKKFSNEILVFDGSKWQSNVNWRLSEAIAGGASVTLPEGVLCIGGANQNGITDQSFLISYSNAQVKVTNMPALPFSLKGHGITTIGRTVYVVGGVSVNGYI